MCQELILLAREVSKSWRIGTIRDVDEALEKLARFVDGREQYATKRELEVARTLYPNENVIIQDVAFSERGFKGSWVSAQVLIPTEDRE